VEEFQSLDDIVLSISTLLKCITWLEENYKENRVSVEVYLLVLQQEESTSNWNRSRKGTCLTHVKEHTSQR
jgi:hypothetical protein